VIIAALFAAAVRWLRQRSLLRASCHTTLTDWR
jgi:hypothetical protein